MQVKKITESEFDNIVLKESRPILVDFYADWCGPCQMMMTVLDELAEDTDGKAVILKVDVDENPNLSKRYDVMSVPRFVFFQNGKETDTAVGVQTKERLASKLNLTE